MSDELWWGIILAFIPFVGMCCWSLACHRENQLLAMLSQQAGFEDAEIHFSCDGRSAIAFTCHALCLLSCGCPAVIIGPSQLLACEIRENDQVLVKSGCVLPQSLEESLSPYLLPALEKIEQVYVVLYTKHPEAPFHVMHFLGGLNIIKRNSASHRATLAKAMALFDRLAYWRFLAEDDPSQAS